MGKVLLIFMALVLVPAAHAEIASVDFVTSRDNQTVHKDGDETINGTKTFNDIPKIPTADLPALQS